MEYGAVLGLQMRFMSNLMCGCAKLFLFPHKRLQEGKHTHISALACSLARTHALQPNKTKPIPLKMGFAPISRLILEGLACV